MTEKTIPQECTVTLSPSGRSYVQSPSLSLLEAGLSAGLSLPYRCANGSCGECRARVLQGDVKKHRFHDYTLPESDRLLGECLLCSTTAVEDVVIEVAEATEVEDIPQQSLQAKLCRSERAHSVWILQFKFIRGKALRFLPGQYVHINIAPGPAVLLPISSCPCESSVIEFHIDISEHTKEAAISSDENTSNQEYGVIDAFVEGGSRNRLTVTGPYGGVSLADPPSAPQLFLATGIEFRSIQGLIEQLFNLDTEAPIGLIWLSDEHNNHYRSNLCRSWADAIDNFSFYPVHSLQDIVSIGRLTDFSAFKTGATLYQVSSKNTLVDSLIDSGLRPSKTIKLAELAKP